MTIQFEISEYLYKCLKKRIEFHAASKLDMLVDKGTVIEQEPKTISIPEGATNGDVFKIMFNKTFPKTIIVYKNDESRLTINPMFAREWWEMPYKESEE